MRRTARGVDLEISVGYRLKQAATALHAAMEEVLRPVGLTITQYATLELLAQRPGVSSSNLARGTFVTRQSMSTVLQSLASAGLVTRAERAAHGRALPVELTENGAQRLRAASAAVQTVEDKMLAHLDSGHPGLLRELLDTCTQALLT